MPAELSSPGWLSTRACILFSSRLLLYFLSHTGTAPQMSVTLLKDEAVVTQRAQTAKFISNDFEIFQLDVNKTSLRLNFQHDKPPHWSGFTGTCGVLSMLAKVHSWVQTLIFMSYLIYIQLLGLGCFTAWSNTGGCGAVLGKRTDNVSSSITTVLWRTRRTKIKAPSTNVYKCIHSHTALIPTPIHPTACR